MHVNDQPRRVVITGTGLICPLGKSRADLWERWAAGQRAGAPIRAFDARGLSSRIAAEVLDFTPQQYIKNRKLLKLLRRGEDFAMAATAAAFQDAQLDPHALDPVRVGVALGCSKEGPPIENFFAGMEVAQNEVGNIDRTKFADDGFVLIPPLSIIEGLPNACLYYLVESYGLEGVNHNFLSYGGGAGLALGEALRAVQRGDADLMLA